MTLDAIPGWRSMTPAAFRLALVNVPGRFRPSLRAAYDAAQAPPPAPPLPPVPSPPVVSVPARGPGVLTPSKPKR